MKRPPLLHPILLCLLVAGWVLAGCSPAEKSATFTSDEHGFTIDYPASWRLNDVPIFPPPPRGTSLTDGNLVITIVAWNQANPNEAVSLREQGWSTEWVQVAGQEVEVFSRPSTSTSLGLWKRAYFEQNADHYEVSLDVNKRLEAAKGAQVYYQVLQSLRWTPSEIPEGDRR